MMYLSFFFLDSLFGVLLLCRNNNNSSRQVWTAQNSSEGLEGSNLAHTKKKSRLNKMKGKSWSGWSEWRRRRRRRRSATWRLQQCRSYIYIYIYIFYTWFWPCPAISQLKNNFFGLDTFQTHMGSCVQGVSMSNTCLTWVWFPFYRVRAS